MIKICIVEDCINKMHCKGYCSKHYHRVVRYGDHTVKRTIRHSLTSHPLYQTWAGMRARCNNVNHAHYNRYGGRGIKVCDRWNDFRNFIDDMGDKPHDSHTLDRVDNSKGYYPDNCKWSSKQEQSNNKEYGYSGSSGHQNISLHTIKKDGTKIWRVKIIYFGKIYGGKLFYNLDEAILYRDSIRKHINSLLYT